jgi:hypothetical protein
MVSKDQAIGGLIFAVCLIVGILYTVGLFWWGYPFGTADKSSWTLEFWLIAIPVYLAFIAIMGIGAWIGWTMFTTPPPKPIEEITSEIEEKVEVKTEEKPKEEPAPATEEEKSPKKVRKIEK